MTPPAPRPGSAPRPDLRTGLLILVALVLAGWALRALMVVLLPLTAALLIGLAVMPVRDRVAARMPRRLRWLGVAAAMGVVLLVLALFFGGLYVAGRQLAGKVPEAAEQITQALSPAEASGAAPEGQTVSEGAQAGAREEGAQSAGTASGDSPSEAAGGAGTGDGPADGTGDGTEDGAADGAGAGGASGDAQGSAQGSAPDGEPGAEPGAAPAGGGPLGALGDPREALRQGVDQVVGAAGGAARVVLNSALAILAGLVLIVFMTFLILIESGAWAAKVQKVLGLEAEWSLAEAAGVVAQKFRAYVTLQAALGATTGTLYAIWLGVWGVDLIIVWALLSFLMNFIPNLGSIIAGGTTTAYALATQDLGTAVAVGAGILTIEQAMGNVVAPLVQGRNIALSPLVVLVSLVFWGWAWGVAGALLAVPLTFALVVLMAHVPGLRPWALLLTDQTDFEGLDEATRP